MNKIYQTTKKFFTNPKIRFGYLSRMGLLNILPDDIYIKTEFRLHFGYDLNLSEPKTFNEKIQWLKLHNRKNVYTTMVDKYLSKNYVSNLIGEEYLIPTIGVYNRFDDINFNNMPEQFVIKCTHDSGGIVICKDKKKLDLKKAKKKINKFLKRKYYYMHREWPYKNVNPKIIVEKYMENKEQNELTDYKVMCFNGVAKIIFTCTERFSNGLKVTFFDLKWNKLPFERHYPSSEQDIPKPKNLKKMIELSEKLSKNIPFLRIDWYEVNGKLYFGELTFYPGGGLEEFTPMEWDRKLGDMIDLEMVKKNEK